MRVARAPRIVTYEGRRGDVDATQFDVESGLLRRTAEGPGQPGCAATGRTKGLAGTSCTYAPEETGSSVWSSTENQDSRL